MRAHTGPVKHHVKHTHPMQQRHKETHTRHTPHTASGPAGPLNNCALSLIGRVNNEPMYIRDNIETVLHRPTTYIRAQP